MDPREKGPKPSHTTTHQDYPGTEAEMDTKPDYRENSYKLGYRIGPGPKSCIHIVGAA